jgi:5'-nucleotidase
VRTVQNRHRWLRRTLGGLLATLVVVAGSDLRARRLAPSAPVVVHLLAFNDFHGNLEPPQGGDGRVGTTVAGGVEYLAAHLAALRARFPNTLTVSAGDNISASPLLSGLFHDEPAIEALNQAGLDVSTVGNHEFDEGWLELRRLQRGGCHPVDGCPTPTRFPGAHFQYLAANVRLDPGGMDPTILWKSGWPDAPSSTTVLPAYAVRDRGGVKVGFIGVTLRDTAKLASPSGMQGITFEDEVTTINGLVPALETQGVRTIVVLIHQGGAQSTLEPDDDINGCHGFAGPIVDIASRLSSAIEVVVSGHTHRAYNCTLDGKLLTSAASYGRVITDIELQIDPATDRLVAKHATNLVVTRDVPADPAESALLSRYRPLAAPLAHRVLGAITATLSRQENVAGESPLGDFIADAQLEAARRVVGPDVAAAFVNDAGIRADLVATGDGPSHAVTYEDLYKAEPFGNALVVKTMTGALLHRLLEQQFDPAAKTRGTLQISGLAYRYDLSRPPGQRVDGAQVLVGGQPLSETRTYRIAMNEFLAGGGDGFTAFTEATDPGPSGKDLEALSSYIAAHSPASPPPGGRIIRVGG